MAGAIMYNQDVYASIIADGHHVDYPVIALAKKIMGNRLLLITDAVTVNNSGLYQHQLKGDKYVMPDGTLSGSALTMLKAVQNCINHVGISQEEALRMASLYPARALKLDHKFGRISKGYAAELLWLNDEMQLKAVYTNGLFTRMAV
jgi:N-acetylglucosamine-6-phosphate deacetylase